jgi:hypothetical protein
MSHREPLCACRSRCGDDGDTEGPGVCKGLPRPPRAPLIEIVLVPRAAVRQEKPPPADVSVGRKSWFQGDV